VYRTWKAGEPSRAGRGRTAGLLALLAAAVAGGPALAAAAGWPMEGFDVRRTHQSAVLGPASAAVVESVRLPREVSVNIPLAVSPAGTLYLGTWGALRSYGETDRRLWNKLDGKVFALRPDLSPLWPAPFPGQRVPYCYDYPGRPATPSYCPDGGTVLYYNGTVEGGAALSADGAVIYVGRGDGRLYAVGAATGAELWSFATFNPLDPDDPDGGGEVVGGPLVAPDGNLYFATIAAGPYETNAVYAVSAQGELRWRYPAAAASAPNTFWAELALSPDGGTLYAGGGWGPAADDWDQSLPGAVYAFDVSAATGSGDQRLRWVHHPVNDGAFWHPPVWVTSLAVGGDGVVYAAGPERTLGAPSAVAFALRDAGDHAEPAWPAMVDLDFGHASLALNLALREEAGATTRVYASSSNPYSALQQGYPDGGKLYALDPATGAALWPHPFDPTDHGGDGALAGIALAADGTLYTGVSGRHDGGEVWALGEGGEVLWEVPVGGLLEWSHPVLGPGGDLYFADTRRSLCTLLPLESGACDSEDIDPAVYAVRGGGEPCAPDSTRACLGGGRFGVEVGWRDGQGQPRTAKLVPFGAEDSAIFRFADPANWEMLVKVLDGCAINGHFWVFSAATTNLEFNLEVTDSASGRHRTYPNPAGQAAPAVTDTHAFPCP
jgi:outer membrane protein assembly factor BamB